VDPRAGLDDVEKRKFLNLSGLELPTPRSSSRYPVAILTTLSRLQNFKIFKYIKICISMNKIYFKIIIIFVKVILLHTEYFLWVG
jgi:hypothetical protein